MLLPAETHSLSAACRAEAVWAPLRVAEQGFKETPPPCVTQTGGDDQGTEISHQPAAPSGKVLWGFPCFRLLSDQFWSVLICASIFTPTDVESWGTTVESDNPVPTPTAPLSVWCPAVQPWAPSTLQALLWLGVSSVSQPQAQGLRGAMIIQAQLLFSDYSAAQTLKKKSHVYVAFHLLSKGIRTTSVCNCSHQHPLIVLKYHQMSWTVCLSTSQTGCITTSQFLFVQTFDQQFPHSLQKALFMTMLFMYLFIYC